MTVLTMGDLKLIRNEDIAMENGVEVDDLPGDLIELTQALEEYGTSYRKLRQLIERNSVVVYQDPWDARRKLVSRSALEKASKVRPIRRI